MRTGLLSPVSFKKYSIFDSTSLFVTVDVMKTLLIPRNSKIFPTPSDKKRSYERIENRPASSYQNYLDWFYACHIDPVQRWIHALGMLIGILFFIKMISVWAASSLLYYFVAVFFFYGSGVVSHHFYDLGAGKSEPKYILKTFLKVIEINILTLTGQYDASLRRFIKKYPFVKKDFDLQEVKRSDLLTTLVSN